MRDPIHWLAAIDLPAFFAATRHFAEQALENLAGLRQPGQKWESPWDGATLFVGVIAWGYITYKTVKEVSELINRQRDALVAEQGKEESVSDWIHRRKLSHRSDWRPWNIATMIFIAANGIGFFLVSCATAHHRNWVVALICAAYLILAGFGFREFYKGYREDDRFIRRRLAFLYCSEKIEGWSDRSVRIAAGTGGNVAADFVAIHAALGTRIGRIHEERAFEERALLASRPSSLAPWWAHQFFVAYADGFPVGRLAIYVASHSDEQGRQRPEARFGFFECVDSARVATALLEAASDWALGHSCAEITGPFSWSVHGRVGVQVGGFGEDIYPLVEDSPPHHGRILEVAGAKSIQQGDAWRYWVSQLPDALARKGMLASGAVDDRPLGPAHFVVKEHTERVFELINERLHGRPGWIDVSPSDVLSFVLGARPDFDPEISRVFRAQGSDRSLGVLIAVPNYLDVDAHRGRRRAWLAKFFRRMLLIDRFVPTEARREFFRGTDKPHWVWRAFDRLRRSERPRTARVVYIVTRSDRGEEAHHLLPHMLKVLHDKAKQRGYSQIEFSIVWEGDRKIRASLERIGARPYKQFRVYSYSRPKLTSTEAETAARAHPATETASA